MNKFAMNLWDVVEEAIVEISRRDVTICGTATECQRQNQCWKNREKCRDKNSHDRVVLTFHAWSIFKSVVQVGENPRSMKLHRPHVTTRVVMSRKLIFRSGRYQRMDGGKIAKQGSGAEQQIYFDHFAGVEFA